MAGGVDYRHKPQRPTLTVAFSASVAFWAGCAAAYSNARTLAESCCMAFAAAAAVAALAALVAMAFLKTKMPAVLAASLALGVLLGAAGGAHLHRQAETLPVGAEVEVDLMLAEDARDTGFSAMANALVAFDGRDELLACQLDEGERYLCRDRLHVRGKLVAIDYGEDSYSWSDGTCGKLVTQSCERLEPGLPLAPLLALRSAAIDALSGDDGAHALLQALVCGYRQPFSQEGEPSELYGAFQVCGLAHLVAVSGAHLVIVTSLFATLFKFLGLPRRLSVGLLVAVMCSYLVLAGMPISAIRATAMSSVGVLALFGKRRPSSMNALGICLFAIITPVPAASVSLSLALSALSTAGIVLFGPLLRWWFDATALGKVPAVSDALSLTFAANALSQLYAAATFGQLPVIAPFANIACAPLFPLVCGLALAAGVVGALCAPAAGPLIQAASYAASLLAAVVELIASVPFASVPFSMDAVEALAVSAALALALWAFWPRFSRAAPALAALIAALAMPYLVFSGGDSIVMLDVGQGDAILVQSQGKALLIDTGNQDSKLRAELARNHVTHLDGVLVTHADDDHCGSLDVLERLVEVDRVFVAADMADCRDAPARNLVEQAGRTGGEVVPLDAGDAISLGRFTLTAIWPHGFTEGGGNADSLCTRADYDGDGDGKTDHVAFFTGDAEKEELAAMIEEGTIGDVDILKVGHHGSRNGSTEEEMRVLHPEIALISCGSNNRYGHPAPETLAMLDDVGARTFRTDRDGEVCCTFAHDRISVTCAG